MKLFAPIEYGDQPCSFHFATQEMRDDIAGGCGPGGTGDLIVPDTLWGISVKPACAIHDWMYAFGLSAKDKALADRIFLNNMVRLIKARNSWGFLENLRLRRARTYYLAVKYFGGPSFWRGKNLDKEELNV
jgi:hypothetical protein